MKAILIDPFKRTITEVDYSGDWRQIGALIGCDVFTVANIGDDDIYVDDEGLLKDPSEMAFFKHENYPQPLCGRGLVMSVDDEGETIAAKSTLEEVKNAVTFMFNHEVIMW
jgi:hypothetical protein